MPCDTIQLNRVDLDVSKLAPALLAAAIASIGGVKWNVQTATFYRNGQGYRVVRGQLESTAGDVGAVADLIRQSYSAQVVKYAAAKNGWKLQQTGQYAYNIIRS